MAPWRQRSAQPAAAAAADAAAALKRVFVIQSFPSESGDLQNTEGGVSCEDHGTTAPARVCVSALVCVCVCVRLVYLLIFLFLLTHWDNKLSTTL